MQLKFAIIFLMALMPSTIITVCPESKSLDPCKCINNTEILCDSSKKYKLKTIFINIKPKLPENQVFEMIRIENYEELNLPEDVFAGISAFNIEIAHSNITSINKGAFLDTNLKTTSFAIRDTHLNNSGPNEKDIFEAVSKLIQLRYLYLIDNHLTSIPDHAFKQSLGTQKFLGLVSLTDNRIGNIGDNAFYDLISLTQLDLFNNQINKITSETLAFASPSNKTLEINLENNHLDSASFDRNWYIKTRRPLRLNLINNKMNFVSERIFSAFLNREHENMMNVEKNPIFCDCKAKWLVEDNEFYKNKVKGMICQDQRNIFDWQISKFSHCVDKSDTTF